MSGEAPLVVGKPMRPPPPQSGSGRSCRGLDDAEDLFEGAAGEDDGHVALVVGGAPGV